MSPQLSTLLFSLSLLFLLPSPTLSQTCVSTEVIFSDLTSINAAFTTQISTTDTLVIDSSGTYLTDTSPNSYGGFFFSNPTDFSGPGGFSIKFVLQSTDTSGGVTDAWEFIVASSSNLDLQPPPYAFGQSSAGLSGWSRLNALVVEFDSFNSGVNEEDFSADHIAVFLSGGKVCTVDVTSRFASGDKYTVWVDYSGFAGELYIRVSNANDESRPSSPTLTCNVDVWAIMDIGASNHVGFFAYNDPSTSGAQHSLVDLLSVADSYNPRDADTCAIFANCKQKTIDAQCLTEQTSSTCLVTSCEPGYVWDVSGTECCAFVEKSTAVLSSSAGSGPFLNGTTVDCESTQRVIATPTESSNCA